MLILFRLAIIIPVALFTLLYPKLAFTKLAATVSLLVLSAFLWHPPILSTVTNSITKFLAMNNNRFLSSKRFTKSRASKEVQFAMKNGGEVGGISNDGNTCFMNSVIQSLASSHHLISFIDSYTQAPTGETIKGKGLDFTIALQTLLRNVNGRYGSRSKEFSTRPLLNKMPNGPKQNFFTGYNQEDAQEFYQLVMSILEKEYKRATGISTASSSSSALSSPEPEEKYVDSENVKNLITGCNDLGLLGNVYVPASHVDPNLIDADHKVQPLQLITPVDGISAERIGCLSCGEVGGIRYSVNSGLSLNLPNATSNYSGYQLESLLNDWITPEIIEDVNCNRCGLEHTKSFLEEKVRSSSNEAITEQFQHRLNEINAELSRPCVTDDAFEKLTVKQMIKKSRKSKQILLSRPPPLLSIHINRSVFDPRTYMVVKNPSKVSFPAKLNLAPYVAEPKDINMDARLPFRKQDVPDIESDLQAADSDAVSASPVSESDNHSTHSHSDTDDSDSTNYFNSGKLTSTLATPEMQAQPHDSRLMYNLKAVILHFGTHNYGHYICYRRLRGSWWRISDESVYIVTEQEVLNAQGTFMVFYEFDNGAKEDLIPLTDSEDESEKNAVVDSDDSTNSEGNPTNDTTNETALKGVEIASNDSENLYSSSDESKDHNDDASDTEMDGYIPGEERAFHI